MPSFPLLGLFFLSGKKSKMSIRWTKETGTTFSSSSSVRKRYFGGLYFLTGLLENIFCTSYPVMDFSMFWTLGSMNKASRLFLGLFSSCGPRLLHSLHPRGRDAFWLGRTTLLTPARLSRVLKTLIGLIIVARLVIVETTHGLVNNWCMKSSERVTFTDTHLFCFTGPYDSCKSRGRSDDLWWSWNGRRKKTLIALVGSRPKKDVNIYSPKWYPYRMSSHTETLRS